MSVLIDENTRLLVQGITGREGAFHTRRMLDYGTNVVAGATPGKGGREVEGVPVFGSAREAVERAGANASIAFVPARFMFDSVLEALDAGIKLVFTIAEHVPTRDMLLLREHARARGARIIGPNSFGAIVPGRCKAGFMAHEIFRPGPVGLMSRSATNCYETVFMLSGRGIGQSACVGVGGDMLPGSAFADLLPDFEADEATRAIVMIGEIGGSDEEEAAEYIKKSVSKPVVALIAGRNAPVGRTMGHAGAIVARSGAGSAQNKEAALRAAGVTIAESTAHIAEIIDLWRGEGRI